MSVALSSQAPPAGNNGNSGLTAQYAHGGHESVLQREADLLHLQTVFQRAAPGQAKAEALQALTAETEKRARVNGAVRDAVRTFLGHPDFLVLLKVCFVARLVCSEAWPLPCEGSGASEIDSEYELGMKLDLAVSHCVHAAAGICRKLIWAMCAGEVCRKQPAAASSRAKCRSYS